MHPLPRAAQGTRPCARTRKAPPSKGSDAPAVGRRPPGEAVATSSTGSTTRTGAVRGAVANTSPRVLGGGRDHVDVRLELVGVATPLVGVRRVERVARVRQRLGEIVVPVDVEERAEALDLGERISHQLVVGRDAPTVRPRSRRSSSRTSTVVAHCRATISAERATVELTPTRGEQQRPRRPIPAREFG